MEPDTGPRVRRYSLAYYFDLFSLYTLSRLPQVLEATVQRLSALSIIDPFGRVQYEGTRHNFVN
jgi:hypothetical protein